MENLKRATVQVVNKGVVLGSNVAIAESVVSRMIGLLGTVKMDSFDGLLITKCNSIHTFFMKYSIDVLFLDAKDRVVRVVRAIPPWRVTRIYFSASKVLEFEEGKVDAKIQVGDQVEICIN